MRVLEVVRYCREWESKPIEKPSTARTRSAHFLSAVFPPGQWNTSETLGLSGPPGGIQQLVTGDGFTNSEVPPASTAMHDLAVGLLCFDVVHATIEAAGKLHFLLDGEMFWELVRSDVLRLIRSDADEGIAYFEQDAVAGGGLSTFAIRNPDQTEVPTLQVIERRIKIAPGHEVEGNRLLEGLAAKTEHVRTQGEISIVDLTNSLLLLPQVRKMLGMSGGTPLDSIPRWLVFPILRLARIVRIGVIADRMNCASVKLPFGCTDLATIAFAALTGSASTEDVASYVLTGRYDADLGQSIIAQPSILHAILRFRDSNEGVSLRKEVFERLCTFSGADIRTSVEGALTSAIPPHILQKARNQMAGLLVANGAHNVVPAIWADMQRAGQLTDLWRRTSKTSFEAVCTQLRIGPYDRCPRRSGEKRRFCCEQSLS